MAIQEDHGHRQQNPIQDVLQRGGLVELHSNRGMFKIHEVWASPRRAVPQGSQSQRACFVRAADPWSNVCMLHIFLFT